MKLAKWDDGYVLDSDPRREDPLYYYMREGTWGSAIGIEVSPLYEEQAASKVTIRVWPEHLLREASLNTAERCEMYPRIVSVLLRQFPKWSTVTLQALHISELVKDGQILSMFTKMGFSLTSSTTDEETWTRGE